MRYEKRKIPLTLRGANLFLDSQMGWVVFGFGMIFWVFVDVDLPFIWFIVLCLFPGIGIFVLASSFRSGLRKNRLLKNGVMTMGRLTNKRMTGMEINEEPVYELIFTFQDDAGRMRSLMEKTHLPQLLGNEERLLYLPDKPENPALLVNVTPITPQIDAQGEIRGALIEFVQLLIIPMIVIGGHGTYVYLKYFQ